MQLYTVFHPTGVLRHSMFFVLMKQVQKGLHSQFVTMVRASWHLFFRSSASLATLHRSSVINNRPTLGGSGVSGLKVSLIPRNFFPGDFGTPRIMPQRERDQELLTTLSRVPLLNVIFVFLPEKMERLSEVIWFQYDQSLPLAVLSQTREAVAERNKAEK